MLTVKDMREALSKLPDDAPIRVEVHAYYWVGSDYDVLDLPTKVEKDGSVILGEVFAMP